MFDWLDYAKKESGCYFCYIRRCIINISNAINKYLRNSFAEDLFAKPSAMFAETDLAALLACNSKYLSDNGKLFTIL